jgi:hypothetical protein
LGGVFFGLFIGCLSGKKIFLANVWKSSTTTGSGSLHRFDYLFPDNWIGRWG